MELPAVIPDTIVQVINALERDTVYRFEWKLSRNLENVSLFVKCKSPAKADNGAKVDFSLPVNPRKKKKKPPSARRRARRRQQRLLKKQPRRSVLSLKQPFQRNRNPFPKNWTFHRRSEIRKEPINLCWWNLKPVARQATPPIWITRHRVFPFCLLYKRSRNFSRTSLQLILTATTILVTQEFVLTVTVNQKKVPNSVSGAPDVTSPDIQIF